MKRTRRKNPHGLALVIVVTVIGMASLIGLVMLSGAALQAEVAHNTAQSAIADYMAESAVQTAAYYLQRDRANMPASWSTTPGYAIFAQNVTVSGVTGSFDVDATATTNIDEFQIYAVGRSSGTNPATRNISAKLKVIRATPTYAAGGGGTLSLYAGNNFVGAPVVANGTITNTTAALGAGSRSYFQSSEFALPASNAGINYYGGNVASGTYTTPAGVVGSPQILSTGTITAPASLTANAGNPGKVFYYAGDVTITGAGTYNATIIARGKIQLKTPISSSLTFNRQAGFPALVADNNFQVNARSLTCNINGVVWAGGGTTFNGGTSAASTHVRINGALLTAAGQAVGVTGSGSMTVTYTPANVDVLNLTTATQPGIGIKYLSWTQ